MRSFFSPETPNLLEEFCASRTKKLILSKTESANPMMTKHHGLGAEAKKKKKKKILATKQEYFAIFRRLYNASTFVRCGK